MQMKFVYKLCYRSADWLIGIVNQLWTDSVYDIDKAIDYFWTAHIYMHI